MVTTTTEKSVSSQPQVDEVSSGGATPSAEGIPWRRYLIAFGLLLSMFLTALDLTIVATAIPRITQDFNSLSDVGWYGSSFFVTFACFQNTWGKLYKLVSMKAVFIGAVAIFEIGSAICGAAVNSPMLIAGRTLTGVGAGGVVGGTYTIMATVVPPSQAPAYISMIGVVFSLASVAGPLLGGVFTELVSWRWCFYINLPVGAFALLVIALGFKTSDHVQPVKTARREILLQLDLPGLCVIVASLLLFLVSLEWGGVRYPWRSGPVLGLLLTSAVLAAIFAIIQHLQGERASVIPRIVDNRNAAALCAFIAFNNMATFLLLYYLPLYFQSIDNASPAQSGIMNLPLILAISISILCGARLVTFIKYFKVMLLIGGVFLTAGAAAIITLGIGTSAGKYIGFQILVGVGNGISSQIPMITLHSFCKPEDLAPTTATVLFFQLVSGSISVAVGQSVFANRLAATITKNTSGITPEQIFAVGATDLRRAFSPEQLPGVLASYVESLRATFIVGTVFAGLALIAAFLPEWKKIRIESAAGVVHA